MGSMQCCQPRPDLMPSNNQGYYNVPGNTQPQLYQNNFDVQSQNPHVLSNYSGYVNNYANTLPSNYPTHSNNYSLSNPVSTNTLNYSQPAFQQNFSTSYSPSKFNATPFVAQPYGVPSVADVYNYPANNYLSDNAVPSNYNNYAGQRYMNDLPYNGNKYNGDQGLPKTLHNESVVQTTFNRKGRDLETYANQKLKY